VARKPGPQVEVYDLKERPDKKKKFVVAWRVGKKPLAACHSFCG
jgi:hypothetical protein